jgi:hypothetical protein
MIKLHLSTYFPHTFHSLDDIVLEKYEKQQHDKKTVGGRIKLQLLK